MRTRQLGTLGLFALAMLLEVQHAAAAPIASGDAIKLDFSLAGDGDGGSLTDWNQVGIGTNTAGIAAGSVKLHGGGTVDNVSIAFANLLTSNFNNDGGSAGWGGTGGDPYYILGADDIYFHGSSANLSVTFGSLDPGLTYNVRIYSLIGNNPSITESFQVTDGAGTQSVSNTRGTRWGAATLEAAGTVFTGLSVNGSNQIVVTVVPVGNIFYPLNAIVLEAVPEPSSLAMLAFGMMSLWLFRKR